MRERADVVADVASHGSPVSSARPRRRARRPASAVDLAVQRDLLERRGGRAARSTRGRASAPTPSTAVCTTISSRASRSRFDGERLADAAHRLLQARALLVELLEALLELARHLVELLAERGELVVALGRDLGAEVARAEAPRGLEEGLRSGAAASARRAARRRSRAGRSRAGSRRASRRLRCTALDSTALGRRGSRRGRARRGSRAPRTTPRCRCRRRPRPRRGGGQLGGVDAGERRGEHAARCTRWMTVSRLGDALDEAGVVGRRRAPSTARRPKRCCRPRRRGRAWPGRSRCRRRRRAPACCRGR